MGFKTQTSTEEKNYWKKKKFVKSITKIQWKQSMLYRFIQNTVFVDRMKCSRERKKAQRVNTTYIGWWCLVTFSDVWSDAWRCSNGPRRNRTKMGRKKKSPDVINKLRTSVRMLTCIAKLCEPGNRHSEEWVVDYEGRRKHRYGRELLCTGQWTGSTTVLAYVFNYCSLENPPSPSTPSTARNTYGNIITG